MSFETIAREVVSHEDTDVLTVNDHSLGILVTRASSIEVAYDAQADPENPDYQGNYQITAISEYCEEPHTAALELLDGLAPWLGQTGNRLRLELLRYPVCHSIETSGNEHPLQGLQRALGISTQKVADRKSIAHIFRLTVGAENISAAMSKLPKDCWTYGFTDNTADSFYGSAALERELGHDSNVIVAPVPTDGDGLRVFDRVIYPLHDNSMHVQSAVVLGTPEVQGLIQSQLAVLRPGENLALDSFFDTGPEKMAGHYCEYVTDWRKGDFSVPYYGLRTLFPSILAPANRKMLLEEIAAANVVNTNNELTTEEYESARALMDRPGNMLDQLDTVAASLPRRHMALARIR